MASSNVLDLVFSNRRSLIESVISTPGISVHNVVAATVIFKKIMLIISGPRKVLLYDKGNFHAINSNLDAYLVAFMEHSHDLEIKTLWLLFKEKLLLLMNIPTKILTLSSRSDKPWLSKDLRASIKRKAKVYKAYCQRKLRI